MWVRSVYLFQLLVYIFSQLSYSVSAYRGKGVKQDVMIGKIVSKRFIFSPLPHPKSNYTHLILALNCLFTKTWNALKVAVITPTSKTRAFYFFLVLNWVNKCFPEGCTFVCESTHSHASLVVFKFWIRSWSQWNQMNFHGCAT